MMEFLSGFLIGVAVTVAAFVPVWFAAQSLTDVNERPPIA
jgi:hypothetical protein